MPESNISQTQYSIKVDGSPIQPDVQNEVMEVVVDQHTHLPHMFTVRFHDPSLKLLDDGPFDLTKQIEITVEDSGGSNVVLIKGEITALEPEFEEGASPNFVIRGFDKTHRLFRESKSAAFLNIKDSDLASQIAGSAGLSTQIDATSTVYDHIYQDNQTDLAFLVQRAWRIGYECFVDEGKLYFRKPLTSGSETTITYGEDLISFYPSMTLAEQVDEVQVKGWDPAQLKAIVGKASTGKLYPSISESKNGKSWASTFGTGKSIHVDIPVVSQAEADVIAQARLDEISGTFIQAEGTAFRNPAIRAGKFVKLEGLGKRMSGKYMVTNAMHIITNDGFFTKFSVRGTRTGLLSEQITHQEPVKKWPGVVTAVVTNTDDPNDWGRVKVKYPWMTEDSESFWARLIGPGAGPEAGFIAVPEVGDEVIVSFEHGDINYPVILGGLWNGKHAIPPSTLGASAGEKPLVRVWQSINGHYIAVHDNADDKIEILTVSGHFLVFDDTNKKIDLVTSGGHKATFDDQGKKLEITSSGGHKITMDDNGRKIIVESTGDLEVKSSMNMKLSAGANLDIQATGMVNVKGAMVKLN